MSIPNFRGAAGLETFRAIATLAEAITEQTHRSNEQVRTPGGVLAS